MYEALVAGIELCYMAEADSVKAYSDSQLVVDQLNRDYEIKNNTTVAYIHQVQKATGLLKHFSITHTPQSENRQASPIQIG